MVMVGQELIVRLRRGEIRGSGLGGIVVQVVKVHWYQPARPMVVLELDIRANGGTDVGYFFPTRDEPIF